MTSANVTEYTIRKDGEYVNTFRKHHLTRYPDYFYLLSYQPLSDYTIESCWLDEEEEPHYENEESLEEFMKGLSTYNSVIRAYFDNDMDRVNELLEARCDKLRGGKWNDYIIRDIENLINILI